MVRCLRPRPSVFSDHNSPRQDGAKNFFSRGTNFGLKTVFSAQKEPMVDASMVVVLRQPNSREESKSIKNGDVAEDWNDNQKGQKDTDAG